MQEVEDWESFQQTVKDDPQVEPDFGEYFDEQLAIAERLIPAGAILYRARLGWTTDAHQGRVPHRGVDIGAPPPNKAGPGRANRQGNVVLYCAESEKTAVAEARPARGYWVSTCRLRVRRQLRVLDLVDGIPVPAPFTDETLAWSVQFWDLLRSFAEALSTPLARADDLADYLPSQKLCEHTGELRYDGVRYPSAMENDGINIVLFDPALAEVLDSKLVEITSVGIAYHARSLPT